MLPSQHSRREGSMQGQMSNKGEDSNIFHIGVKPIRIHHNSYNLRYLTYGRHSHLIINHGEQMIMYDSLKKQVTRTISNNVSAQYTHLTYSNKFKCFFLLDANQLIKVYSLDQLVPLAQAIDIKSIRHCIDFLYLDQYGAFIVLCADSIKLIYVQINSNHLRSLFPSAYKFQMKEVGSKQLKPHYFLQFANRITRINQYFLLTNCDCVKIIWHAVDRTFHQKQTQKQQNVKDISKGILQIFANRVHTPSRYNKNTVVKVKNICQNPQQISFTLFDPDTSLLLCGTSQGSLKVYKINIKNVIATTSPSRMGKNSNGNQIEVLAKNHQIFTLKLHNSKAITNIQMYSPKLILTIGLDEYIQVVSYDQMASIQRFKASTNLTGINFITNSMFLGSKTIDFDQYLYGFEISLDYQLKIHHNSQIMHTIFNKDTCALILSDNSLNILQLSEQKQSEKIKNKKCISKETSQQKNQLKQLGIDKQKQVIEKQRQLIIPKQSFVPPRCKSILAVQNYPKYDNEKNKQNKQQFWVLTDESQIYRYVYFFDTDKFQIMEIYELNQFTDSYNHETKQKIVTMKFVDIVPVYFDSDIKEKKYYPNFGRVELVRPIAFGCETGEILICSSLSPTKIISRLRVFGEPVKTICSCFYPQRKQSVQQIIMLQDGMNDSMLIDQKQKQSTSHRRRLLIFNSDKQIVAVMISNCFIPQTIYKLMLNNVSSIMLKNLGSCYVGVVTGSLTKVLFPCRKNASKLRIWVHSSQIHEADITCLEHCQGIKSISGDAHGKVVLWNLMSQILAIVTLSDRISIQLCYCWNGKIMFGHTGKIFQINKNISKNLEYQTFNEQQLAQTQSFINQLTLQASLNKNNQTNIRELFKVQQTSKMLQSKMEKDNMVQRREDDVIFEQKSRQLQKYVKSMKKTLIKLTHQTEGHNNEPRFPISGRNQTYDGNKIKRKIQKSRSVVKHFQLGDDSLANSKVGRAKSILNKFRQAQQKDFQNQTIDFRSQQGVNNISLPQIKNNSIHPQPFELNRKKKNRNKTYQFLFHFPNAGLYNQLISKNMIQ